MRIEEYDIKAEVGEGREGATSSFFLPPEISPKNPYLILQDQNAENRGRFEPGERSYSDYFLRAMDIVASILLLVLLAPLLAIIALVIVIYDPGPVIFAHYRVGKGGKRFPCLKFRSMYVGAEQRLAALLAQNSAMRIEWERDQKLADDPRITRVGSFLRVTSLDELPQLLNVLRGEMSLVGPRPIVDAEIARYGRFIGSYYCVKPGLTGLWQVTGRSDTSYRRRVATDVFYARSKSIGLNIKIMIATIPAVLAGKGSC